MSSFLPLAFLGIGLWSVLLIAIWHVARNAQKRKDKSFGFSALMLVAWLDVVAFLGGFSIGWSISLINIFVGLAFVMLTKHYRLEILFASLISLLLALFMRGHFLPAQGFLEVLLFIVSIGAAAQMIRSWKYREVQKVKTAGLIMVACLGFLSLLLGSNRIVAIGLAVLAGVASIFLAMSSLDHRWKFFLISTGCLLWIMNLLNS